MGAFLLGAVGVGPSVSLPLRMNGPPPSENRKTQLTPTPIQLDQAAIAAEEFGSLIDRLIKEGFDYRSLLSGAAAALAESIIASAGAEKAAHWFAGQSLLVRQLNGRDN